MRGRLWLHHFIQACKELEDDLSWNTDEEWTESIQNVMDTVAEKMKCRNIRKRPLSEDSREHLNVDAFFFDLGEYDLPKGDNNDPLVLPRAIAELENKDNFDRISYSLWKLLCVRSPVRALICYQKSDGKLRLLKEHLEDVIWKGSLMKGDQGDLLVIIGDDSKNDDCEWRDYFTVFEWRHDRLEKVEGLEW